MTIWRTILAIDLGRFALSLANPSLQAATCKKEKGTVSLGHGIRSLSSVNWMVRMIENERLRADGWAYSIE